MATFVILLLYHYFLAQFVQYFIHYSLHTFHSDLFKGHFYHHDKPYKITWYGNPHPGKTQGIIYDYAIILYVIHIFILYSNKLLHICAFSVILSSFLVFHGMCHNLSEKTQKKIPFINILFFHHYKHHIENKKINFGFGDLFFDFLFGTLDLSPVYLNTKRKQKLHDKYFSLKNV